MTTISYSNRWIYWKPTKKQTKWVPIPDTREARSAAIEKGAMFFTWAALSEPFKGNGQPEPVRYGDFPLDFDSADDPGKAWEELGTLVLVYLPEEYGVDPYSIQLFLSGGKGYHAIIPAQLFGAQNGDPHLPLIYKKIASLWKAQFNLSTLDLSLYCMGKGKMFRIANVRRSNGRYKVPIALDEIKTMSAEQLHALDRAPREIDLVESALEPVPELVEIYQPAQQAVYSEIKKQKDTPPAKTQTLSKDLPACISYILSQMPRSNSSTFNKLTMCIVCFFQAAGYSKEKALSQAQGFLTGYPHSTSYTTPEERLKHFSDQWPYLESKSDYTFDCCYILGLGFPGNAFDCQKCGVKRVNSEQTSLKVDGEKLIDEKRNPLAFPRGIMSGVAGKFAKLHSQHLESPSHFFYMAFLTCLGVVLADRLTLATEIKPQPRFFTILLGKSADDRKSTAIKKSVDFFRRSIDNFPTCWGVGSAEGLQKRFKDESRLLLCLDEFKAFVGKCKIEASVLLPCVNTLFESNNYESWTKKTQICLSDVHLSILAASTVETYERTWDSSFTDIGFNNRLFLVPGSREKKYSFPSKVPDCKIEQLKTDLHKVLQHTGYHPELDMADNAKAIYNDWYMNLEGSIHAKRLDTYALRFMALLAVNELKTEIDSEIVNKAIRICNWQFEVRRVHDPIDADNAMAKMELKIRKVLERGALTDRKLKQLTNANRAGLWFYNQAKNNLLDAGEIKWDKGAKKYAVRKM